MLACTAPLQLQESYLFEEVNYGLMKTALGAAISIMLDDKTGQLRYLGANFDVYGYAYRSKDVRDVL